LPLRNKTDFAGWNIAWLIDCFFDMPVRIDWCEVVCSMSRVPFRLRHLLLPFVLLLGLVASSPAMAQTMEVTTAFDDSLLRALDYPEIEINVGPDGLESPASLDEGWYLITLSAAEPYVGYLDIMIPPDGLDTETMTAQALGAGRDDLALADWVYVGGTNTFDLGVPVSFAAYLRPGDYQVAASYYLPEQGSEEIMTLNPLTVNPTNNDELDPEANGAPDVAATLEMTDEFQYIVTPDVLAAGPQIWKFENTGTEHSHHVVMMKIPAGTTAQDLIGEYSSLMQGTPPAEDSLVMQMEGAAYAALQSGGYTTYVGLDLEPGTYAVLCFIINHHTGMPHLMDGMVTVFTVE
jgi:hypothetical protein